MRTRLSASITCTILSFTAQINLLFEIYPFISTETMPVGEMLLSAFFQVLFDRLASRDVIEFATLWNVKPKLEKLATTLSAIQAVLIDAEEKQITSNAVRVWLDDLQNLAYDAEDLLDEFATETLGRNIKADSHTNQVCGFIATCIRPTTFNSNFVISSKIEKITENLEEIVEKKQKLGLIERAGQSSSEVRERTQTTSLVSESCVYGREKDKKKIIDLLLSNEPSDNVVFVIPIVGMGGAGKTTLAQAVYNHEGLKNHFDLKAWACVSDDFDVKRVTLAILESATKKPSDVKNLELLQVSLKEVLNGKKFLLVLDDMWSDKYNDWDELRKPFRAGAQGSKIIVTTRSKVVASMMGSVPPHGLGLLSEDDCWLLFTQHAFENINHNTHPNLEAIRKKIVERCGGLPLAAKTLGGLLRSKVCVDEWEDILNSEIWRKSEGDILPVLRVSYHHLPAHLKRCFVYCAIFPYDFEFNVHDLVLLWMAEGFVQPKENKRLEDIGREYFRDLFHRSFFQTSSSNESNFLMHDLINDLAQSVSRKICFRLDDRLEGNMRYEVPKIARHSSYLGETYDRIIKFQPFYEVKSLRTFLPLYQFHRYFSYLPNRVSNDLFLKLRCLRVLNLSRYDFYELPDSIGKLKLLRYLDLSYTQITKLPESTSTLYNLQTLKLNNCFLLSELPKDLGNLINLRHLDTFNCGCLETYPLGIGRMTSLQSLLEFVVGYKSGLVIRELGEMVNLQGSLCISMLKNVVNSVDATYAKLKNKQHLHTLMLRWSFGGDNRDDSRDERIEGEVLAQLQPHTNLQNLTIKCYGGTRFPSWIGDPSYYNIVILILMDCWKCESLPPLGQLRSLKYLQILSLYGVKSVGREFYGNDLVKPFPSLQMLTFGDMLELEEWSGLEEGKEFPCLCTIQVEKLPKLRRFSIRSHSLEELVIQDCGELSDLSNGVGSQHFASLRDLKISNCPQLVILSNEDTELPANLEHLQIIDCKNLKMLPQRLHNLMFLKKLKICGCSALGSFPEMGLPTMLTHLEITNCKNLKSLPEGMTHNNMFLEYLIIQYCDSLTSFPRGGLPTSLEYLYINGCSSLVSLPEQMQNNTSLENLTIKNCHSLMSFPRGSWLSTTTLKSLEISKCPLLMSFPEGGLPTTLKVIKITEWCSTIESLHDLTSLQYLQIEECPSLVSFSEEGLPNTMETLKIYTCKNLKALPNQMHNLTSLVDLEIVRCSSLVSFPEEGLPSNIKTLRIESCKNLKALPHRMHNLTSLQDLTIDNCPSVSFPEGGLPANLIKLDTGICDYLVQQLSEWGMQRLTSLARFSIGASDIKSLPKGLHSLTHLEEFSIHNCHKLASFPKEGLPTTLRELYIYNCPMLKQRYQKRKGAEWHKIAHIPRINIDGVPFNKSTKTN